MVVIFGFGPGSPEDLGEVALGVGPNCHNQVFLHHVRSKKPVRLYFVPTQLLRSAPGGSPKPVYIAQVERFWRQLGILA